MSQALMQTINDGFDNIQKITPNSVDNKLKSAIAEVLDGLDSGQYRIAEKIDGQWQVHEWLKKAVLLYFRTHNNQAIDAAYTQFYDKVPMKYAGKSEAELQASGVRIVPDAIVRYGAYVGENTVLMPSYINLGAYVDSGCMIDTWATVGSCAQVGKNVHISGGAGLGGVLEPLQANPTIIEDNCFIGARSEIVEGAIIGEGSVIAMGVFIGASTKIYNRLTGEVSFGYVPPGSVVVPGSLPSSDGSHHLNCAVIVKQVTPETRAKVSINELLRSVDEEAVA
jgi:2,3,4,5-tetrahydropyridine-2-carboxylate N-succinyltransferase